MIVAQYFVYFLVFSIIGWIYECTFCTVIEKKWQNRGFLYGPICPIYGIGATGAVLAFRYIPHLSVPDAPIWQIFLVSAIGSAVLEYTTSYILEKIFHAVWWDYSGVPLNLHGRICLPATCAFGVVGVLVARFLVPALTALHTEAHPIINEIAALAGMAFLAGDLALTVASLTRLIDRLDEMSEEFDRRMEAGVELVQAGPGAISSYARVQAKLAAAAAEKQVSERIQAYAATLSKRQLYHLRSIRGFRSHNRRSSLAQRLKNAVGAIEQHAQETSMKQ